MKLPLCLLFCTLAIGATAQVVRNEDFNSQLRELLQKKNKSLNTVPGVIPNRLFPKSGTMAPLPAAGNRKPGLYRLSQDHMPCIVPDTGELAIMPNAAPKQGLPYKTGMPNIAPSRPIFQEPAK
jgi:hypothetical protein